MDALVAPNAGYLMCFAVVLVLLGGQMFPVGWEPNEMHYFELSYRFVRPDQFGPYYAAFDAISFRSLGLYVIGFAIDGLGYETAHLVLGCVLWLAMSAAVAFVLQGLRIPLAVTVLAFTMFYMEGQSLMGEEWIFDAIEGKVFAYIAVFAALGLLLLDRLTPAVLLLVLATYLHFLVGGFWGIALILLAGLRGASAARLLGLSSLFVLAILPLFWLLLKARFGVELDLTGLDRSVNEIYAAFRHAHHVAPFEDMDAFRRAWKLGAYVTLISAVGFLVLWRVPFWPRKTEALWLGGISTYLLVALGLAWLDRHTHALGTLYIFRPSALTLLLTLLVALAGGLALLPRRLGWFAGAVGLAVFVWISVPAFVGELQSGYRAETLEESLSPSEAELVAWTRAKVGPDEPILILPWPEFDDEQRQLVRWGFERLVRRPTMIEYKFVPTAPADLVLWYRLFNWQSAVIKDGCARVYDYPAVYVIAGAREVPQTLISCTEPVFENAHFAVLKVQ